MKKIFGILNPFEVSNNYVLKLFSFTDYCPHILPIILSLSVRYQKFYFEKCLSKLRKKKYMLPKPTEMERN